MIGLTAAVFADAAVPDLNTASPESPVLQLWCGRMSAGACGKSLPDFCKIRHVVDSQPASRSLSEAFGNGCRSICQPYGATPSGVDGSRNVGAGVVAYYDTVRRVCLGCMFCMAEKFRIGFVASDIIAEYYWRKQPVQTSRLEFAVLYLAESVAYYSCPKPACLDGGDCLGGAVYQSRAVAKQLQVFAIKLARQFFGFLAVHARTYQRLGETLKPESAAVDLLVVVLFPEFSVYAVIAVEPALES